MGGCRRHHVATCLDHELSLRLPPTFDARRWSARLFVHCACFYVAISPGNPMMGVIDPWAGAACKVAAGGTFSSWRLWLPFHHHRHYRHLTRSPCAKIYAGAEMKNRARARACVRRLPPRARFSFHRSVARAAINDVVMMPYCTARADQRAHRGPPAPCLPQ